MQGARQNVRTPAEKTSVGVNALIYYSGTLFAKASEPVNKKSVIMAVGVNVCSILTAALVTGRKFKGSMATTLYDSLIAVRMAKRVSMNTKNGRECWAGQYHVKQRWRQNPARPLPAPPSAERGGRPRPRPAWARASADDVCDTARLRGETESS